MSKKRRNHSAEFKAKVAMAAIKGVWTCVDLDSVDSARGLHPVCPQGMSAGATGSKRIIRGRSSSGYFSADSLRDFTSSSKSPVVLAMDWFSINGSN